MKTVAIDFDGVIHSYTKGWQDGSIYDTEVKGALTAILKFKEKGWSVYILSTRNPYQIKKWLENLQNIHYMFQKEAKLSFKVIPWWMFWKKFWSGENKIAITQKKLAAHIYIDDRAYKFTGFWDNATFKEIVEFKTYQQ